MDSHIRTTATIAETDLPELAGRIITDEKSAYELARKQAIVIPYQVGRFSANELTDLATFPVNVTYEEYLDLQPKTLDQLIIAFPELNLSSDLDHWDAFFYATRGIPSYAPNTQEEISRYRRYQDLSNIGKGLLNLIYQDQRGFALANEPHPLELHIISFDRVIGDSGTIISIGNRIGFHLYHRVDYTPVEQFINKTVNLIEKFPGHPRVIKRTIDMTRTEFIKQMDKLSQSATEQDYNDRLNFLPHVYQYMVDEEGMI